MVKQLLAHSHFCTDFNILGLIWNAWVAMGQPIKNPKYAPSIHSSSLTIFLSIQHNNDLYACIPFFLPTLHTCDVPYHWCWSLLVGTPNVFKLPLFNIIHSLVSILLCVSPCLLHALPFSFGTHTCGTAIHLVPPSTHLTYCLDLFPISPPYSHLITHTLLPYLI